MNATARDGPPRKDRVYRHIFPTTARLFFAPLERRGQGAVVPAAQALALDAVLPGRILPAGSSGRAVLTQPCVSSCVLLVLRRYNLTDKQQINQAPYSQTYSL